MAHFFLSMGGYAAREPQIAAAVVLFTDRASPAFEVADVLDDWMQVLHRFLEVADSEGELGADIDLLELAEYIFITNLGEAIFGSRAYAPIRATPRMRILRVTLRNAGVRDVDAVLDEVLNNFESDPAGKLPGRSGLKRRGTQHGSMHR